jgi:hypothetical protein
MNSSIELKRRGICMDRLVDLYKLGKITLDQQQQLFKMLASKDEESRNIVMDFLDALEPKDKMTSI